MVSWKDIKSTGSNDTENQGFFPAHEFMELKQMVNRTFDIKAVKAFINDKGPGVAMLVQFGETEYRMVTHSVGIVSTVTSEEFKQAIIEEPVTVTLKEAKSKKTGKYFYYLE